MKIAFLSHNIYGIGGTNRTVINLATALAARHRVEIASVFRRHHGPMLAIPPAVRVVPLIDLRRGRADLSDPRRRRVSELVPVEEEFSAQYSHLSDERIAAYLSRCRADVVIGTRPALNLCLARIGPPGIIKIAQEHTTHESLPATVRAAMRAYYPRLAASVTLTSADAAAFQAHTPVPGLRLLSIPNSVPPPRVPPSDGSTRLVVAAGRLDPIKRYDLLVRAFGRVVATRPDWRLRIYGDGTERAALADLVVQLGLHNHVLIMGRALDLASEWVKGSIAAVTSDQESFGMTVVEAMRCGLPVVSTACPVGPPEIITHGVDGLLVPVGDVDAIADALLTLINDDALRGRLGAAAVERAQRFDPAVVSAAYERLFAEAWPQRPAAARLASALRGALPALPRPRREQRAEPAGDYLIDATGRLIVTVCAPPRIRTARLLCRNRDQHVKPVCLPVGPAGAGQVVLAAGQHPLGDGRWNLYLLDQAGRTHRLRAGTADLRGLLRDRADPATLTRFLPYRTLDGYLCVRSWRPGPHAEADDVTVLGDELVISGRLIGASSWSHPPVLSLARPESRQRGLTITGSSHGAADFRFIIPVRTLVAKRLTRRDEWQLAVLTGPDAAPATVGRLLDDLPDKRSIFRYPTLHFTEAADPDLVDEHPPAHVTVTPSFTRDNDLAIVVTDAD